MLGELNCKYIPGLRDVPMVTCLCCNEAPAAPGCFLYMDGIILGICENCTSESNITAAALYLGGYNNVYEATSTPKICEICTEITPAYSVELFNSPRIAVCQGCIAAGHRLSWIKFTSVWPYYIVDLHSRFAPSRLAMHPYKRHIKINQMGLVVDTRPIMPTEIAPGLPGLTPAGAREWLTIAANLLVEYPGTWPIRSWCMMTAPVWVPYVNAKSAFIINVTNGKIALVAWDDYDHAGLIEAYDCLAEYQAAQAQWESRPLAPAHLREKVRKDVATRSMCVEELALVCNDFSSYCLVSNFC